MPNSNPSLQTFNKEYNKHAKSNSTIAIPVYRRIMSDSLTPVLAYRRLVRDDQRMAPSFLLESVVNGQNAARYSYMGAKPACQLIAKEHEVEVQDHLNPERSRVFNSENPLQEVQKITQNWESVNIEGLPKFSGGWVGVAGYDTVRYIEKEKLTGPPTDDRNLPDLHMQLYIDLVAFDHVSKTVLVITHALVDDEKSIEDVYKRCEEKLDNQVKLLTTPWQEGGSLKYNQAQSTGGQATSGTHSHVHSHACFAGGQEKCSEIPAGNVDLSAAPRQLPNSNMGEDGYRLAVDKCKEYIQAGDIFQVVPSQRFELTSKVDPFDIYRALRVVNPSPYMFYMQIKGAMLVGSSPEILCKVTNGKVTNRPLAGTRKRGKNSAEDSALEQELRTDDKDKAEHIMLVDLGRNDVGKISETNSVKLESVMDIERFSHVMHLSSTITGKLRQQLSCWDALAATLPVGTLSGAPKIRAMQIIDELEPTRRGPYGGAIGYVDFTGNMDMAIVLRTMVIMPTEDGQWKIHIQAGGGIVADSDRDSEHQETVNKAAALAKAIDVAEAAFAGQ